MKSRLYELKQIAASMARHTVVEMGRPVQPFGNHAKRVGEIAGEIEQELTLIPIFKEMMTAPRELNRNEVKGWLDSLHNYARRIQEQTRPGQEQYGNGIARAAEKLQAEWQRQHYEILHLEALNVERLNELATAKRVHEHDVAALSAQAMAVKAPRSDADLKEAYRSGRSDAANIIKASLAFIIRGMGMGSRDHISFSLFPFAIQNLEAAIRIKPLSKGAKKGGKAHETE